MIKKILNIKSKIKIITKKNNLLAMTIAANLMFAKNLDLGIRLINPTMVKKN